MSTAISEIQFVSDEDPAPNSKSAEFSAGQSKLQPLENLA